MDILHCVKPIQRDLDTEANVIHIGTNDLTADKTLGEIFSEILRLIKEHITDKNKIDVSTIVPSIDPYNTRAEKTEKLKTE